MPFQATSTAARSAAKCRLEMFLSQFAGTAPQVVLMDNIFADHVNHLYRLVTVSGESNNQVVTEASVAKVKLLENKQGCFFKALTLFATGMHIVDLASLVFSQKQQDDAVRLSLESLVAKVALLTMPDKNQVVGEGHGVPTLPDVDKFADAFKSLAYVIANSSMRFRIVYQDSIKTVVDKISAVRNVLTEATSALKRSNRHSSIIDSGARTLDHLCVVRAFWVHKCRKFRFGLAKWSRNSSVQCRPRLHSGCMYLSR